MENKTQWASEALVKIERKMRAMNERNSGKIPYLVAEGRYTDLANTKPYWWTNGFFAGSLWQLYNLTGYEDYRKNAEWIEATLDKNFDDFLDLHHDVGFMWLLTAVANYRQTGNELSRKRALHAATLLAGRFNINGCYIRAWNSHYNNWAIIDSLMNIPILYWASKEMDDPRFSAIAKSHADRLSEVLVRSDGSVGHIAEFNPETGKFIKLADGQGYSPQSAWSRGNAWALYGYTLSYVHTKEERYLGIAKQIAHYFIANVAETDYKTLVDFKASDSPIRYDSSAGLCAACGLLELSKHVSKFESKLYRTAAEKLVRATLDSFVNYDETQDGVVTNVTVAYHRDEDNASIVYGDYFLLEALLRITEQDVFMW